MATAKKKTTAKRATAKKSMEDLGHRVTVKLPRRELDSGDLVIAVKDRDQGKIGTLRISRGGLDWYPKSARQKRRFTWKQLAAALDAAKGEG